MPCSGTRFKAMPVTPAESANRYTVQITYVTINTIQHACSKEEMPIMERERIGLASFYFEQECRQAPTRISSILLCKFLLNVLG